MSIILNQPNTTSTARVLITEAKKDLGDISKPKALTKVVTQDRQPIEFWSDTNIPLGKAGEVVDVIVTTEGNQVADKETGEPSGRYYFTFCTAPSDFFTDVVSEEPVLV
jgi:hypothetical protein